MKTTLFIILSFVILPVTSSSQTFFQKITTGPVVTTENYSNMSAWGDYDNDGDQDFVVSSIDDSCGDCPGPLLFFKNNGDGSFTRIFDNAIAELNIVGSGLTWCDYDNDSYLDFFVCGTKNSKNKLFHNERNGNFSIITEGIVVNDENSWSQGSAWADYNKDGFMDLFVTNRFRSNFLYKNNGNGTFTKITSGSIVNDIGSSRACAWGDYNNDSWPDLFVVNYEGINDFLYKNNGDGTFTRIFNVPMVNEGLWGAACAWNDYDNNGYLDLYVTGNYNRLYYNHGDGVFTVSNSLPGQTSNRYGFTWGDYDNDGLSDLLVCGGGNLNTLYKNNGGSSFTPVTSEIVSQEGPWSVTGSMVDYNNDGRLDIFITNRFNNLYNYLYKNIGETGNYITIKLKGCQNKFGIGARIKVYAGDLFQMKEVSSGSGWGSDISLWSHFGLGNAQVVDSIVVNWTSDSVTKWTNQSVNRIIMINECPAEAIISEINNTGSIPLGFKLYQNYPNPFNPSTVIRFEIPENSNVKLTVYDALGKEAGVLLSKNMTAGIYNVNWNADGFANGVYYYRLESGSFSESRKMMLIR